MELLTPSLALIFWILLMLITLGLWVVALVDIVRSDFIGRNDKLLWGLIVLFAPFVGVILYFLIGRQNKVKFN